MGRPRTPASQIVDGFSLAREVGPSVGMALHKGKKIFRSVQGWQAERVVMMDDEIEWRLFWRGHHVHMRVGDLEPTEMRDWLITEIDQLDEE